MDYDNKIYIVMHCNYEDHKGCFSVFTLYFLFFNQKVVGACFTCSSEWTAPNIKEAHETLPDGQI